MFGQIVTQPAAMVTVKVEIRIMNQSWISIGMLQADLSTTYLDAMKTEFLISRQTSHNKASVMNF